MKRSDFLKGFFLAPIAVPTVIKKEVKESKDLLVFYVDVSTYSPIEVPILMDEIIKKTTDLNKDYFVLYVPTYSGKDSKVELLSKNNLSDQQKERIEKVLKDVEKRVSE